MVPGVTSSLGAWTPYKKGAGVTGKHVSEFNPLTLIGKGGQPMKCTYMEPFKGLLLPESLQSEQVSICPSPLLGLPGLFDGGMGQC